ncbi:hypothetical protein FB567DRAFT_226804 [Paraphoma chrysanthemicola]|uniref:Oxidase ustYa n=1 Tax=Paraphoma chrysanthemicola TaxID=798071 RepID=A0A8K0RC60_9PLEO|nr:hypothetical protein FB567DRAFT_226804 [Paraphoma chrysanthemicola]
MPWHYAKIDSGNVGHSDGMLEQQQKHTERGRSKWLATLDRFGIVRWPLVLLFLFAILMCEISILQRQPKSLQIGGEINGLVPRFSQEQKIFREDSRYASDHMTMESINATKQHWKDLMPRGDGFLDVSDFNAYTLPPPMHYDTYPGKEVYAIAVYHQLHCLMHMSGYIDKLVMQIRNKDFTLDEGAIGHNDHCFNYLRNALMCCGDTTLEGQSQAKMFEHVAGTDGTGAVHMCRKYDEISAWATGKRLIAASEHL